MVSSLVRREVKSASRPQIVAEATLSVIVWLPVGPPGIVVFACRSLYFE